MKSSELILLSVVVCIIVVIFWLVSKYFYLLKQIQNQNDFTKFSGRKNLIDFLQQNIESIKGNFKAKLILLIVDLDNFKDINDSLGYDIGEQLIQKAGEIISAETKFLQPMVAHLGGDEFAVAYYSSDLGGKNVSMVANSVIKKISQPMVIERHNILITCSIGICIFPDHADSAQRLLQYASIARYNAKKLGRDAYSFYNQELNLNSAKHNDLVNKLRLALKNEELSLHYQPKVDAVNNRIEGAEALLRWGNISPETFIPIAEETGLIISIGDWVIDAVCRDLAKLAQLGVKDLSISFNLSFSQFNKGDIVGTIAKNIWEKNVNPNMLEIELTESVVVGNEERLLLMLKVLKSMGLSIAVDDFGTGYSSLAQLKKLPIDIVKIDKSFIMNLNNNAENKIITSTIIGMAKKMGIKVVAEGIESQEQAAWLKKEGCDSLQGYFFSKPVPYAAFERYLQNRYTQAN